MTADGLIIFWEKKDDDGLWIYTAHRRTADEYFTEITRLFPGRHPTISGDGTELIFLGMNAQRQRTLCSARRRNSDQPFTRAVEIPEFKNLIYPKCPCLSEDGLMIYFRTPGTDGQIVVSERKNRTATWSSPKSLLGPRLEKEVSQFSTWPFLSKDRLTLLWMIEKPSSPPLLVFARRSTPSASFDSFREVDCGSLPDGIRCPRFVDATKELFFNGHEKLGSNFFIGVVKGFSLPD